MTLLAITLALALAAVVQRVTGADAPLLLVLAIVLGAWRGGLGGGLLATALACAIVGGGPSLQLLPPTGAPSPWPLLPLALAGAAIATLGAALRHARSHDEREFSEAMIESMPGVLYVYTEQGRFLRWNRNMEQATGYSHAEIAALHPLDVIPEQDRVLVQARIATVFETGEAAVETGLRAKDGSCTPYFFTGRRLRFRGVPCLVGVGLDLSQRDDAVHRLRNVQDNLEKAQRIAHLGSWELEIPGGALAWSDETYRIFDIVPGGEPVSYARFIAQVHPDDRDAMQRAHEMAVSGEMPLDIEHRIVRADGDVRWVHELAQLQHDAPGPASRLIGTARDVTDRKRAQLQLQETLQALEQTVAERTAQLQAALRAAEDADRVKSAFLATMSHELRTPLNSIIGFTGILLQSLPGPINAEQVRQLGMVRGSARHLLELINDVLDISRIEAGQMPIHANAFDLAPLVAHVVAAIAPQAEARGLALHIALPGDPVAMTGDRRRVEQVLINLVGNAVKFTERGGVTVRVDAPVDARCEGGRAAGTVRVQVIDTGIGIAPDDLEAVCRPFHQVDSGLTRSHEGTGLGLAISHRLVSLMGGRLDIASVVGTGSTFTVTLPQSTGASDA